LTASELTVRRAGFDDVLTLVQLRLALFRDLGNIGPNDDTSILSEAIRGYLERKLAGDGYVAWVAEVDDRVVAAASAVTLEKMPSVHNPTGREAYIMSVYTIPAYRRLGAGEAVVRAILTFAQEQGITRVSLHASDYGRPLYERLGFQPTTSEMRWTPSRGTAG
jgi:GNAT superfamily N-acetyltransferase